MMASHSSASRREPLRRPLPQRCEGLCPPQSGSEVNRSDHHACDAVRQNQGSAHAGCDPTWQQGSSVSMTVAQSDRCRVRRHSRTPYAPHAGHDTGHSIRWREPRHRIHTTAPTSGFGSNSSCTLAGQFKSFLRHIFAVLQHVFHGHKHIAPVQAAHVVPHIPKPTRTVREWAGLPSRPSRSHATLGG